MIEMNFTMESKDLTAGGEELTTSRVAGFTGEGLDS